MRRAREGVGERKRVLLSLENDEIDEKERGKGEVVVVRVLRRGSSLRGSRREVVEKRVM